MLTGLVGRTATPPAVLPGTQPSHFIRTRLSLPVPTGRSRSVLSATWPGRREVRQFLDPGTGIPTAATPTRSPRRSHPSPGWCTWTTTL